MVKLLVVSDNKQFIQKIYEYLSPIEEYSLNAVLYSGDIFDGYIRYQPQIILLDSGMVLPIQLIANQFKTYNWRCDFVVIQKNWDKPLIIDNCVTTFFEKDEIVSTIQALSARQALSFTPTDDEQDNFYLTQGDKNDVFNMMLCVCAKQKEFQLTAQHISNFKAFLTTIGRVDKFVVYGTDILIIISKQNLRSTSDFLKIPSAVTEIIHPSYACIYELDLTFEQLDLTTSELLNNAKYGACFALHSMTLSQIAAIRRQSFYIDTYRFNVNILTGALLNQRELVEQSIYQLYLVDIKQNLDISSIFANRRWIMFFDTILFSTYYFKDAKVNVFKNTVEHEYQYAIKFWFFIMNEIVKNPIIPVVQDCLLLILKELSNYELSLNMIADKLVFAKSYLSRAFKSRFKITIGGFITKLRMEYACQLLENSNNAVKDISAQIGYQDPQYFSKLFYSNIGLYPKEYRKKCKEDDLK